MVSGLNYRIPTPFFTFLAASNTPTPLSRQPRVFAGGGPSGGGVQIPITSSIAVLPLPWAATISALITTSPPSASDPLLTGGLGLKFALAPTFALQVAAQYNYFLGLYQGMSAGVGVDVSLGNLGGSVDVPSLELAARISRLLQALRRSPDRHGSYQEQPEGPGNRHSRAGVHQGVHGFAESRGGARALLPPGKTKKRRSVRSVHRQGALRHGRDQGSGRDHSVLQGRRPALRGQEDRDSHPVGQKRHDLGR